MKRTLCVLICIVMVITLTTADEIENGGFETGDTTGWDVSITDEGYVSLSVVDTRSASGSYSLRIAATADEVQPWNFGYVSQPLNPGYARTTGLLYSIESVQDLGTLNWYDDAGEDDSTYPLVQDTGELWFYGELLSTYPEGAAEPVFAATALWNEFYTSPVIIGYYDNISIVSHDDIINPGFEDDWLWGWAIQDGDLSYPSVSQSSEESHSGTYSLKLYHPVGSDEWLGTYVTQPYLEEDTVMEYTMITFWYNVPSLDPVDMISVEFVAGFGGGELGGSTSGFYIEEETDGWVQGYILTSELYDWSWWGHPSSGTGRIAITLSNYGEVSESATIAYFDDFEFYKYTPDCEDPVEYSFVNGNFETGDLTGWTLGEWNENVDVIVDTDYALEGDYGCGLISTVEWETYAWGYIYQTVNLTCAKYLYFDLWTHGDFTQTDMRFSAETWTGEGDDLEKLYLSPVVSEGSLGVQHVYVNLTPFELYGERNVGFSLTSGPIEMAGQYLQGRVFLDNVTLMYDRPEHQYINSNWEQLIPQRGPYGGDPPYWFLLSPQHCMHEGYMYSIHLLEDEFEGWSLLEDEFEGWSYLVTRSLDGYEWEITTEDVAGNGMAELYFEGKIVSHNGDLYAACHAGDGISELFISEDDGYTWEEIDGNMPVAWPSHSTFSLVSFGDYIYMTPPVSYGECPEQFIYRTLDGDSWELVTASLCGNCYAPSLGFVFDDELYVFLYGGSGSVFYSTADGTTWQYRGEIDAGEEWASWPIELFANETTIFYVTNEGRIYTSNERCANGSWVESETLFNELEDPEIKQTIGPEFYGGGRHDAGEDGHPAAAMYNGNALFVDAGAFVLTYNEEDWWVAPFFDMWASYEPGEPPTPEDYVSIESTSVGQDYVDLYCYATNPCTAYIMYGRDPDRYTMKSPNFSVTAAGAFTIRVSQAILPDTIYDLKIYGDFEV